jgi:pyruvate kinase
MQTCRKKTKIVATLGPASSTTETISALLEAGVDVFRINFSHGTRKAHQELIRCVREAEKRTGRTPALLADLQGPKIRTGRTEKDAPVTLTEGDRIRLSSRDCASDNRQIFIDYPHLAEDVEKGSRILLNDGAVALEVTGVEPSEGMIRCRVLNTGSYSSHKGVNFPHARLKIPALTARDKEDLDFILSQEFHFVAMSFVRHREDLTPLREITGKHENPPRIIAKIEKPEAAENIRSILKVCDGIMVARGDLGVEAAMSEIPIIQKKLIQEANNQCKAVIVATQMLESMIHQPLPTRAETTDVANALLDGTDAVMLSGETAVGKYPVGTVRMMTKIIQKTESSQYYPREIMNLTTHSRQVTQAVCEAAALASRDLGDIPVVALTQTGSTAWYLANIRAQGPLYAFSPSHSVVHQLSLTWNTMAFQIGFEKSVLELIPELEAKLISRECVKKGDPLVIVSGMRLEHGATNLMRIKRVGEE